MMRRAIWLRMALAALGLAAVWVVFARRPTASVSATPAPTPASAEASGYPAPTQTYEIVTLLPRDAIPAINNPEFYAAAEADAEYGEDELVLGVALNGDSRAYSTSLFSTHEIVNDTVGGRKIAVTW